MFAGMVGAPPQPADQRKNGDKMDQHFEKLQGLYSDQLLDAVKWCLKIDPLDRPQSMFALQKLLLEEVPEPVVAKAPGVLEKVGQKLRGMLGSLGKKSPDGSTIQEETR